MVRIRVDPAQLRALGAQWQQTAGELRAVEGRLGAILGGLEWEVRQKAGIDAQVGQAQSQARFLADQADALARYLVTKAQAFEEADGQGVSGLGQVFDTFVPSRQQWLQSSPGRHYTFPTGQVACYAGLGQVLEDIPQDYVQPISISKDLFDRVKDTREILEGIRDVGSATAIALMMRTYGGKAIVYGTRALKEQAGLATHLTHISADRIPLYMARRAVRASISPISVVAELGSEALENWEEYEGDTTKAVVGMVFDTALDVTISTGFATAGAAAGAAAMAWAGPPGMIIGGAAGRVIGGWVGSQVAEWVENFKIGNEELDHIVVESTVEAGRQVERAMEKAMDSIVKLFD